MAQNGSVTAPGSQGVFWGKGGEFICGRQATIQELVNLVQLPGQAL
jgi:hypothetical protein